MYVFVVVVVQTHHALTVVGSVRNSYVCCVVICCYMLFTYLSSTNPLVFHSVYVIPNRLWQLSHYFRCITPWHNINLLSGRSSQKETKVVVAVVWVTAVPRMRSGS
eukprot:GHVS01098349.1.p2 GENE.GHVS01098349.1~~GHVS01098349.1.p2  ORF type:complete len:106 (-),score=22.16 GHVS01098349.1:366-683(-)